jgi:hypothetical protein
MKQSKISLLSIAALLVCSLACSAVSSFVATPTPAPTSTPPPSPTPEPNAEIFSDNFSSTSTGWGTGTDAESSVEYVDGGLQFKVFTDLFVTWSGPDQVKYSDVHIDVTVKNNSTDELALFGIICHEQDSQDFYYLGVGGDGYYAIAKSEVGKDNEYYSDGNSSAIPTDNQPFTLGADCGSGNLALYVNGQQIASAQDSSFTSGYIGLFAWSNEIENSTDVTFDDFVLSELD